MLHNATGTHQPMSMPHDLTLVGRNVDSGNGERVDENGVNGPRSLTTDLIGAVLPQQNKEETSKMESKDAPTTSTGISSAHMDEVLKSIQNQPEIFDLQKIRDKIDAKKFSAHDEIRRAMAAQARIEYPEPQYIVYANDCIEELQFYIEM
ncbi:hypothetical protein PFISCL1PPCAC_27481 [Pristionchus fissidentatus]|uniref:Uncharacterized protein n=1 Tax=Pristionchus fissidentatus TaxID=1538716 RepID=A0AAV5WVG7_9BILA|nr:hypothetical protein PFISCL1PPCAC_27481 [Pristionchus fissidentatus]